MDNLTNVFDFLGMSEENQLAALLKTPELPELGPGPRSGVLSQSALNAELEKAFRQIRLPGENQHIIRALILLWHEHLDAAHEIAQGIDNGDGAYVHAIMHRREPDYGNSAYWFKRVGRHSTFPELAKRATNLLSKDNKTTLQSELVLNGEWQPFGFVNACERASIHSDSALDQLLRKIQQIEFETLLESYSHSHGSR
jgi:hypothetical protein